MVLVLSISEKRGRLASPIYYSHRSQRERKDLATQLKPETKHGNKLYARTSVNHRRASLEMLIEARSY
jgi:hypothetical protein